MNIRDFIMDLMNADFNNDDLTDWLTIAWKCSQSPKNTLTNSFWADQPAEKGTVPEVFRSAPPPRTSIEFGRSVFILTWRGVRVGYILLRIPFSLICSQLVSYMRNMTGFPSLFF